ncbi:hypothetical protein MACH10_26730 [Thalassospira tepidiphila]|nr:hypothetical protein MACH10_26730 [Thalassospira tepidiphila]
MQQVLSCKLACGIVLSGKALYMILTLLRNSLSNGKSQSMSLRIENLGELIAFLIYYLPLPYITVQVAREGQT